MRPSTIHRCLIIRTLHLEQFTYCYLFRLDDACVVPGGGFEELFQVERPANLLRGSLLCAVHSLPLLPSPRPGTLFTWSYPCEATLASLGGTSMVPRGSVGSQTPRS